MKKHAMCSVLQSKKRSIGENEFIESQNEPTANGELIAQQQEAPAVQQEAPAVQQEAPAVQQEAPAVQQEAPTVQQEAPVVHQKTPVVQQEAPAVQQEALPVQQKVPADVPEPAKKQRKPFAVRVLLVILYVLLGIIALVLLYVGFSAIDCRNPDKAVAADFALYANISSVYKVAKPIADSPSFEALLKENGMTDEAADLAHARNSFWYKSALLKSALSRTVSFALYDENTLVAAIDMGWVSCATRLVPLAVKFGAFDRLPNVRVEDGTIVVKASPTDIYINVNHNLVIAATSKDALASAMALKGKKLATRIKEVPVNIVVDMAKLSSLYTITDFIESYGVDIESARSALSVASGVFTYPLFPDVPIGIGVTQLGQKKSVLVERFAGKTATCIALQVKDGKEFKDTVVSLASSFSLSADDMRSSFVEADDFCRQVFNMPLDDLLESAKIEECAIVQPEGFEQSVFILKADDVLAYKDLAEKALANMSDEDKKLFAFSYVIREDCFYLSSDSEALAGLLEKVK